MSEPIKILGNERNIAYLTEAKERGKLSHAYIIEGDKGFGKKTFADFFAMKILCTGNESAPCGKCPACVKALSGNHPDLIHVTHSKKTVLSIAELREQLIETAQIPPYYGPYKIYVIEDAELMNEHGQNALLKTIEEPPPYMLIFILTKNANVLLDTILSRCVRLTMEPLRPELVTQELKNLGTLEPEARSISDLTKGNLGEAIMLAKDPEMSELRRRLEDCMKNLSRRNAAEIERDADIADPDDRLMFLRMMMMWFRDVLFAKAGDKKERFYFKSESDTIFAQSKALSYEGINNIINEIKTATLRLKSGVKADSVMEMLLLNARRAYIKE